jgi:peroxiredoxin
VIASAVVALLIAPTSHAAEPDASVVLPAQLTDVNGDLVDVAGLARGGRLFVVTVKATSCEVCREQLSRLRRLLPRLRACGAHFLIVAPGSPAAVAALAADSALPSPFVADTDLTLARAADLVLAVNQIVPAVLEVDAQRRVVWHQRGRAPGAFSDPALLERLDCRDLPSA